jgi:hypothetical protein
MNASNEHDNKLIELVAVMGKLSPWNKFLVWSYAWRSVVKQNLKFWLLSARDKIKKQIDIYLYDGSKKHIDKNLLDKRIPK